MLQAGRYAADLLQLAASNPTSNKHMFGRQAVRLASIRQYPGGRIYALHPARAPTANLARLAGILRGTPTGGMPPFSYGSLLLYGSTTWQL